MQIHPIGVIHSPFHSLSETPLNPNFSRATPDRGRGSVVVDPQYAAGLQDLSGFERIWLLFWFDRAPAAKLVGPTFMDSRPHGIFATRMPSRPNPIGMSCVKLLAVTENVLQVEELDILDGTPLLDIKPYTPRMDVFQVQREGWIAEVMDKKSPG